MLTDPQASPGLGRSGVLSRPAFRLLFTGQTISVLGDRLVLVALPFAVLSIRGAGLSDVGVVLGASALSLGVFVLIGGVVADRFPRRYTMLVSDLIRAVAQGLSAVLLLSGQATVIEFAVLQAVYGGAEAFFRPAALGLVPQVVEPGQEQAANALLALSSNLSMVVGPVLAGLLVAGLGAGATLAVDAVTFLVSAVTLVGLRPRPADRANAPRPGWLSELAGGWREVRSRSWVWSILLAFTAYHALVLPALFVLGPQYAASHRGGAAAWGIISAGFGVGAVGGSLLSLRWRPQRPGLLIALPLALASSQALICVSPLPTVGVALLEAGTGVAVSLTFTVWETALQQRIPEQAQSRVSSFDYLGSVALMPLGYVLVGPLTSALGTRWEAAVGSIAGMAACCAVAASPGVRRLRKL